MQESADCLLHIEWSWLHGDGGCQDEQHGSHEPSRSINQRCLNRSTLIPAPPVWDSSYFICRNSLWHRCIRPASRCWRPSMPEGRLTFETRAVGDRGFLNGMDGVHRHAKTRDAALFESCPWRWRSRPACLTRLEVPDRSPGSLHTTFAHAVIRLIPRRSLSAHHSTVHSLKPDRRKQQATISISGSFPKPTRQRDQSSLTSIRAWGSRFRLKAPWG